MLRVKCNKIVFFLNFRTKSYLLALKIRANKLYKSVKKKEIIASMVILVAITYTIFIKIPQFGIFLTLL